VTVSSDLPVLASQRVTYWNSFNEVAALSPAAAAGNLYLSWFDRVSAGMNLDNVHITNPSSNATVTGTISAGGRSQGFTVGPNASVPVTLPAGTIGGPVSIAASAPVLASQRVTYYSTFNEVAARPAAAAASTQLFQWFDSVSPGMSADNIHVLNPPGAAGPVTVTVSLGSASQQLTLQPGAEAYVTFPRGLLGGPVRVSVATPGGSVLASQRVAYYQSFNEVSGRTQ